MKLEIDETKVNSMNKEELIEHLGQSGNVAYVGSVSCGECKNYGGQTKEHVICNAK